MAQSFEFQAKLGADLSEFNRELNDAAGDVVKLAQVFKKFQADASDPIKTQVNVQLDGRDAISGKVQVVTDKFQGLDKGVREIVTSLNKLNGAEKGSVTRIKQQISALQQAINATKRGTANYKLLEDALKATRLEYNKAAGIQKGSVAALKQQAAELERLANSYTIGSREQRRFSAELDAVNRKINGSAGGFAQFGKALEGLAKFQSGFLALSTIIQSITGSLNKFIGQAKQVEGFELALRNIGLSGAKTNRFLKDAAKVANDLGAPIQQVEKSFKRMVPALKAVGVNSKQTTKFIEAITARTQTLGLNTEQSGRFLEAFAQVLSKGKLQAEELNQQISELDGAFRVQLAEALDVTTGQLEKMIQAGEVTSDKFVKAVSRMNNGVEELRRRVASGNFTLQQLQNLVNNLQVANLREIGQVLQPAIKAFFDIGRLFQEFVSSLTKTNFGQFVLESINGIVIGLRNFANIVFETTKAIVFLLDPLFAFGRFINNLLSPVGGLIGVLTTYVATLVAVTTAQRALNAAAFLSKATWTGLPQIIQLNSRALSGLANAIKSVKFAEMIPNLKNIGSLFSKNGKAIKGAGAAAGKTKAQYNDLQSMFNQMVPSLATSTAGTKALGGAAKIGAAKIALLAAKIALLAAALTLVLVPLGIFTNNVLQGQQEARRFDSALSGLKDKIRDLGKDADNAGSFFPGLGEGFASAGRTIARVLGSQNQLIMGAKTAYISYGKNVSRAQNALLKLGVNIKKVNTIQSASDENLRKAIETQQEVVDSTEAVIDATKERIKQAEREGDTDFAKYLREQLQELQKTLPTQQQYLKNLKTESTRRKDITRATGKSISSLKDLNEFMEMQALLLEEDNIKKEAENFEEYGKSASQAYQLQVAGITRLMMLRNSDIKNLQFRIAKEKELRAEGKLSDEEMESSQKRIKEFENEILQKTLEQKKAQQELKNVVIDSFEARLQKSSELAASYDQIASSIASAAVSAGSALTSTYQSISTAVDQVFSREIEGLRVGSSERRKLVEAQLRTQLQISRIETQIAKVKNDIATRVAISELRTSQQRLRNEAAIARLRGDEEGAQSLEAQANATGDIIKLKQVENRLTNRSLDINQRLREDKILQKGIDEKIAGNYTNQQVATEKTSQQLGIQRTSQRDIARYSRQTREDYQEINKLSRGVDENLAKSDKTRREAPNNAANEATKLAPAIMSADKNAKLFLKTMDKIYDTTKDLNTELANAQKILSGGGNARWMGGPVEGGQTYRVNDAGLGREAFMNKFGNISLLPAGSNINWTAPSSGTIIPAAIVKQMQRNADTNQSLSQAKRKQSPSVSINAGNAMGGNSGNLVKQMTAAIGASGGNQRITNNVTIQSQQPVTDASQIMTNVARMRLRNSRRI